MSHLLYPWDEGFQEILHSTPPPQWREQVSGNIAYITPDSNGVLTAMSQDEFYTYLDENPDEDEDLEDEDSLWLPY